MSDQCLQNMYISMLVGKSIPKQNLFSCWLLVKLSLFKIFLHNQWSGGPQISLKKNIWEFIKYINIISCKFYDLIEIKFIIYQQCIIFNTPKNTPLYLLIYLETYELDPIIREILFE